MYTNNNNVYIKQDTTNKIYDYPIAVAVPITNNQEDNINSNDRNIYNSYRSIHNSFTSIDLNTQIPSVSSSPSPSLDLTKTYPDGLKTPPPNRLSRPQVNNYKSNPLILYCRDCQNMYTPDPYDVGSMRYYRCEQCSETFVTRSCCASCTIS